MSVASNTHVSTDTKTTGTAAAATTPTPPPSTTTTSTSKPVAAPNSKDWGTAYQILPYLYLAGVKVAHNAAQLQQLGITHICNVTCDDPSPAGAYKTEFSVLEVAVDDVPEQDMTRAFQLSFEFIDGVRAKYESGTATAATGGGDAKAAAAGTTSPTQPKCLVHCSAGISRSASCVIHFILRSKLQPSLTAAYEHVKKCKPNIEPQPSFMSQLSAVEFTLTGKRTLDVQEYAIGLLTGTLGINTAKAREILVKNKWDYKASMAAAYNAVALAAASN